MAIYSIFTKKRISKKELEAELATSEIRGKIIGECVGRILGPLGITKILSKDLTPEQYNKWLKVREKKV